MIDNASSARIANAGAADSGSDSPFHAGELALQERVGVREKLDRLGRKSIRPFLLDQHREFFARLPFFFLGSTDLDDRPWASILVGEPGFISSPDTHSLHFAARLAACDPLSAALCNGATIGGLGIDLQTRRRNRVNGKAVLDPDRAGFSLAVEQSFGNCAQYIQARATRVRPLSSWDMAPARRASSFDPAMLQILAIADTFFIASRNNATADRRSAADISHRGGRPGFIDPLDDHTLQWPEYRGNFFFNTLGNLAVDSRCSLLFVDFEHGGTLQLTGRGEILWNWDRNQPALSGAQCVVRFHLEEAVHVAQRLPFEWEFLNQAPQLSKLE